MSSSRSGWSAREDYQVCERTGEVLSHLSRRMVLRRAAGDAVEREATECVSSPPGAPRLLLLIRRCGPTLSRPRKTALVQRFWGGTSSLRRPCPRSECMVRESAPANPLQSKFSYRRGVGEIMWGFVGMDKTEEKEGGKKMPWQARKNNPLKTSFFR